MKKKTSRQERERQHEGKRGWRGDGDKQQMTKTGRASANKGKPVCVGVCLCVSMCVCALKGGRKERAHLRAPLPVDERASNQIRCRSPLQLSVKTQSPPHPPRPSTQPPFSCCRAALPNQTRWMSPSIPGDTLLFCAPCHRVRLKRKAYRILCFPDSQQPEDENGTFPMTCSAY